MIKKIRVVFLIFFLIIVLIIGALINNEIKTKKMLSDYSSIYSDNKYLKPVYVDGIKVIKQKISCGYAVIEMFSSWNNDNITEKSLFDLYGKVITSTGKKFEEEMNKQFPKYKTTMYSYLNNKKLIEKVYESLLKGMPVPIEWAAKYNNEWTLHYSLVIGIDIKNDLVIVANPYGYIEKITIDEFLKRTSFEAFNDMPFYLKLAFAFGLFEKNTIFIVERY